MLPCLDEARALPWVLDRVPEGIRAIVVDNGSSDGSPEVAVSHADTRFDADGRLVDDEIRDELRAALEALRAEVGSQLVAA